MNYRLAIGLRHHQVDIKPSIFTDAATPSGDSKSLGAMRNFMVIALPLTALAWVAIFSVL